MIEGSVILTLAKRLFLVDMFTLAVRRVLIAVG